MATNDLEATPQARGCVGIFWVFKGHHLLALPVALDQAEQRERKIDSPQAHVSEWPRLVSQHRKTLPLLSVLEYDEVPRGRVIFDILTQTFVIYMDESLFTKASSGLRADPSIAEALRTTFALQGLTVRFATDPHYRLLMPAPDDNEP